MAPATRRSDRLPKWLAGPDLNKEARHQAAIVEWFERVAPQCTIIHIPNGGPGRSLSRLKWMGARPGAADLLIIDEHTLCYFMEVKAIDGELSADQKAFRRMCDERLIPYEVVHDITEASRAVAKWGIPTKESKR